ncbi:putative chalcone--flavonone isomerase 3 [Iris pallida]|uniref:Chalcone--flavonone isomerase 3 n=1 Tax=Iris pallida TaxID=29817 RepID=A0AAX6E143_IRIPA|nr:putative chalcone--flavonone isomerase 3 [Iris pallida]
MSSEMVMVDAIPFPPQITTTKPLALFGTGLTDVEVHFLQIKYNAIGIYLEKLLLNIWGIGRERRAVTLPRTTAFSRQ